MTHLITFVLGMWLGASIVVLVYGGNKKKDG